MAASRRPGSGFFNGRCRKRPAGLRIFACQHKTRETVWIPELMKHANGAKRLKQALVVSPEPAKDAAHLARLIDGERQGRARWRCRGAIRFGSRRFHIPHQRSNWAGAIPKISLAGLPERGGAGLVLATSDLAAAEKAVGKYRSSAAETAVCVAPAGGQWYAARFHPGLGLRRAFSLSMMLPRMPLGRKMMKITSSAP